MFPARIPEGKAPRVMALIDGITFPLLLDTGGEVSVLHLDLSVALISLLSNLLVVVLFLLSVMELSTCSTKHYSLWCLFDTPLLSC